ncbi:GEVED domain-containing protein [Leeuwenhoekiella sp. A16]|uniref:GEVED domain-containing protein n=1 Tax=unclassified Leeuwenhoekiella TaxID=2615029 RepID=UPI003A80B5C9
MRNSYFNFFGCLIIGILFSTSAFAQKVTPRTIGNFHLIGEAKSIAEQIKTGSLVPPDLSGESEEVNPKRRGTNKVVPGKGFPKGNDPLVKDQTQTQTQTKLQIQDSPLFVFDVGNSNLRAAPSDPTGAAGPNHYIAAWNSAFRIFDKQGNPLMNEASLATLFPGNELGDPIVLYDAPADRYIITEFDESPNGLNMAISKGRDPINDGWYIYTTGLETNAFPDYAKFSIWHDGYYVTANIPGAESTEVDAVFAIERDKMLVGEDARILSFPLPGIELSGFYSPQVFNVGNRNMPASGPATVVYMQDDAWSGVDDDHLKLWSVSVDWNDPLNSTISQPVELTTAAFNGVFDGGSFSNLSQPGDPTNPDAVIPDLDALQATIMNQAQFRQFDTYNSVVFNFVVDVEGGVEEKAGIRWYELRQSGDGQPWSIYQEGTYVSPTVQNAFAASMAMDSKGNIGMGYSTVSETQHVAIQYTGRFASDKLGSMTIPETLIAQGSDNAEESRYGDYTHLTVDPEDDKKFWFVSEYFNPTRQDVVGVFQLEPPFDNDVEIVEITAPQDDFLSNAESVTIRIRNLGNNEKSNFPISYSIDGGTPVTEMFTGTLAFEEYGTYTFSTTADLSTEGKTYAIEGWTSLEGDEDPDNDRYAENVTHLWDKDLGVTALTAPVSGSSYNDENITISLYNYGGTAQSNFPVTYSVNGDAQVTENFTGILPSRTTVDFTFAQTYNFAQLGAYNITASTNLTDDSDHSNDNYSTTIYVDICKPEGNCESDNDGVTILDLQGVHIETECNATGYARDNDILVKFDTEEPTVTGTLQTGYEDSVFAIFIDFNDDSVFDADEIVAQGTVDFADTDTEFTVTLPRGAALGKHKMRVRGEDEDGDGDVTLACDPLEYGRTNDYMAEIYDSLGVEDEEISTVELNIIENEKNKYTVSLESLEARGDMAFSVYNLLGQTLVYNWIPNEGGRYEYDLDMSYAAPGIYIVRLGNKRAGGVKKILVK